MVSYDLCHNKTEKIFFFKYFFYFLPPLLGVSKIVGTRYNQRNENNCTRVFDRLNEASGCTALNEKNLNSLQCTVDEKMMKNLKKSNNPVQLFSFFGLTWVFQLFRALVTRVKHEIFVLKKCFQFSYGIRHMKPPGPEQVWYSPPFP